MIKESLLGEEYRFSREAVPGSLSGSQKDARRLFLEEIDGKDRYARVDKCPFCGAQEFTQVSEKDARGLPSEIVVCDACGACFKSRILDPEANRYHYENISYILRGKDRSPEAVEALFNKRVNEFAYPRYSFIRHFVRLEPGKDLVVELGCGDGANLLPWKREKFEVLGLEFDPLMAEFGKGKGISIVSGDFMTYDFTKKPRLIILSHFLEHVSDVNKVIERIYSILDPRGYLFIEVPGMRVQGLGKPLLSFDTEHNFYFDLQSLSRVLEKNMFEVTYGDEYIRAICRHSQVKGAPGSGTRQVKPALIGLFREAEAGSLRIKILNKINNAYFKAYYMLLSAGAGHDKT